MRMDLPVQHDRPEGEAEQPGDQHDPPAPTAVPAAGPEDAGGSFALAKGAEKTPSRHREKSSHKERRHKDDRHKSSHKSSKHRHRDDGRKRRSDKSQRSEAPALLAALH